MRSRPALVTALAAAFALGPGCQERGEKPAPGAAPASAGGEADVPVARIDDVVITVGELEDRINQQSPYVRGRYTSIEHKREFLTNLIRFEVLALEAKRRGLDKDPDAVRAMKQVMIQKLLKDRFEKSAPPEAITDDELRAHYEKNRASFDKPEEVRVAAIVLDDPAAAEKVAARARSEAGRSNAGYHQLVKERSVDEETRARGGDLRYFSRANREIPAPVIEAAFALEEIGDVSGAVADGQGRFYILKKTGYRPAVTTPFDKVKMQIRNRLYREQRQAAQRQLIEDLRAKATVEVLEDNLRKVRVDTSRRSSTESQGDPAPPGLPDPE